MQKANTPFLQALCARQLFGFDSFQATSKALRNTQAKKNQKNNMFSIFSTLTRQF